MPAQGIAAGERHDTARSPVQPNEFAWVGAAPVCIAATQFVFWTFPINQQTSNWAVLSENWMELRRQWEYSHAASAALNLVALVALICSALVRER